MDSFASKGPTDANIKTYKAENGLIVAIKPPAIPMFAKMIENSPLDTIVNPIFTEALWDNPALRPAIIPATKFPQIVNRTAPSVNHTAPPSEKGSILKPKLKKKMAPKKSRKGTTRCSIRSLCSVSEKTNPKRRAPIASATRIVYVAYFH